MQISEVNAPTIYFLTDEIIDQYASEILTDYRDINLRYNSYYHPYKHSVLDPTIFGSLFEDRCNCGRVKVPGETCPVCGAQLLDEAQSFSRYAKIELPCFYITEMKFAKLYKFLQANFRSIQYNLTSGYLYKGRDVASAKMIFDICQMSYDEETDILTVTDEINDYTKCSFEGLEEIFRKYKSDTLREYLAFINHKLLVIPLRLRPVHRMMTKEGPKLDIHEITKTYQNIIYLCTKYYRGMEGDFDGTQAEWAMFLGTLRGYFSKVLSNISNLMRSSKQNLARTMQSTRISNSGRCTIIPGPHLKIDEVELPRTLYYEACREEFTKFVAKEFNTSMEHAEILVTNEARTEEIQQAFSLFVEGDKDNPDEYPGKYVIINRAPTLHEYNLMCCKVHLTNADTMSLPMALCVAFNADYDGDTMSWFDVPQAIAPNIKEAMSPRKMLFFKKNHEPMFLPTQEIIQGLILATKTRKPEEIKNYGNTIEKLEAYRIQNKRTFKYQTIIEFNGKQTTLAREILSKHFNCDINDYIGGLDRNLTSKTIPALYTNIIHEEDRAERILAIQTFALKIVTITGVTSLSLEDLYNDLGDDILKEIRRIEADETLSENEKNIKARLLYEQYIKQSEEAVPDRVMTEVKESARMKASQLMAMINPFLTTSVKGELSLGNSTIINGLSSDDLVNLAVENRGTQAIKQDNVPGGGYFTRQMVYLAGKYTFVEGEEPENKGILIERRRAVGRTLLDGEIVGKNNSDDMVYVRSIVTSDQKYAVITKDLISNIIEYKNMSNIGMSMITSLSEGLTQGMLGLKHGGNLFSMRPDSQLEAPADIIDVQVLDNFVLLKSNNKVYKYPKPSTWTLNYSADGTYKKGEPVGYAFSTVTPSYVLDCFVKLTKARKVRAAKRFAKNTIIESCCFSYNEGPIKYNIEQGIVSIGDIDYPYNNQCLYPYAEGEIVKPYTRFASGLLNLEWYMKQLKDYTEAYYIFRAQVREMASSMVDELCEFLYKLIVHVNSNGQLVNRGVINSIHEGNSFFTELAAENYRKAFMKLEPTGTKLISDTFGSSFLPMAIQSSIQVNDN